jgi:hypothetical protein
MRKECLHAAVGQKDLDPPDAACRGIALLRRRQVLPQLAGDAREGSEAEQFGLRCIRGGEAPLSVRAQGAKPFVIRSPEIVPERRRRHAPGSPRGLRQGAKKGVVM